VPITLEPRSPYFALLDFCHFKANEISERQEGRRRKERKSEEPCSWALAIDAEPDASSSSSGNKTRDGKARQKDKPNN